MGVWGEDVVTPSIHELVVKFRKDLDAANRNLRIWVSFIERVQNLTTFADGPATLLLFISAGLASVALSLFCFIVNHFDPHLRISSGIIGFFICIRVSYSKPPQRGNNEFPVMTKFNQDLECFPDEEEMAHRYIATRIQVIGAAADPPQLGNAMAAP